MSWSINSLFNAATNRARILFNRPMSEPNPEALATLRLTQFEHLRSGEIGDASWRYIKNLLNLGAVGNG